MGQGSVIVCDGVGCFGVVWAGRGEVGGGGLCGVEGWSWWVGEGWECGGDRVGWVAWHGVMWHPVVKDGVMWNGLV